jgi:D-glycero-D-manno-heptose 1,7-bisphosphate phosphatase
VNKALFLDRDGIMIEDVAYPHKPEDLHIKEELIPHLLWAQKQGFKLIIVTNQAGIAKGKFTLEQYQTFQNLLLNELQKRQVIITAVYFCPYHKNGTVAPYNVDSPLRKPAPGLFLQAQKDHDLNLSQSFMIGDKSSDNIQIPELRCYILKSPYTIKDKIKTYNNFNEIFGVIKNELS